MIDFQEVMQRMKEVILSQSEKKKVLDRDIADVLNLSPQYYAVIKKRNKIPYENLAYFCQEHKISMNWILLKQKPEKIK
ncbi:phage repressor protein, putative [hydrothermal vent metagenome]|uniref:Phage repressor protein, putative n=1 Tax=hydrothermal vent metagenome TaxID=652676 RepID=A0A1W1EF46_9ZZZZ